MKLKGHVLIELTDVDSGRVEKVEKENMVTNAVNHLLGLNPMGVFYSAGGAFDDHLMWNDEMLPVCPNMIGGLLLFGRAVEEDPENIYQFSGNMPVAYASNDVNSTANLARGSMNLTESKALDHGYKFVWEFSPSQGNGTIAALALTSARGGKNGFGSMVDDASPFFHIRDVNIGDLGTERQMMLFEAVEMDFENDLMYSITFEDAAVRVRKIRIPVFSIGLNERLDDSTYQLVEEQVIQVSTFRFLGDYSKYGDFLDGHDGYWYGVSNEENASGDAKLAWVKIKKEDYSVAEGEWTLSNAKMMDSGSRKTGSYPERYVKCCIRNGFLYVMASDKNGVYRINLKNQADVSLISLGFTSKWQPLCEAGSCEVYMTLVGDVIVGGDFQILDDDTVVQTAGSVKLQSAATPLFRYKEFLVGWGGSYGNEYRHHYLLMPYLATVNNLGSVLEKTADKTMKITYTLTEEA